MMDASLSAALRFSLGAAVARSRRLSGGDINDAFELELVSGVRVFLKTNPSAPPSLFPAEARGLDIEVAGLAELCAVPLGVVA